MATSETRETGSGRPAGVRRGCAVDIPPVTVHELFARTARAAGDTVAVVHGTAHTTYRQLDAAADAVAGWLREAGLRPGEPVALWLRRGPALFAAMLGVLRAGGAYLPLDVADPDARVAYVLDQAGVTLAVTDGARELPTATSRVLAVGAADADRVPDAADVLAAAGGRRPAATERATDRVSPESPAYVIFTSGSTGRPKGVAMSHRALVNLLTWHDRTRPGSCRSRTAQVCAVSFDFSCHEILSTLCFGGTLVVADEDVRRNPFALADLLATQRVERLFLPVTALTQLAEAVRDTAAPPALAEVVTTGERLRITPALRELFRRTGARLHNHFGATEFQDATVHTLAGAPAAWPDVAPIGRPLDNVQVYVLDEELRPVATAGEEGELCVAGAQVAAGYLNRPDLTAQRFLPNPFGEGRLYRTGDRARVLPDGTLELLGRLDEQVKIRGVRVEPAEVEAALGTHPDVAEAVVLAHEIQGHRRLVAHLVLRPGATRDGVARRLRDHLAQRLPPALVPDVYDVRDAMPLTSSGKTDRRRLTPPAVVERLANTAPTTAGSATERLVAEVWREVLGLASVGVLDTFFELGGTSLHLVTVQRRLSERLGRPLPVVDLFRHPTVRALAAHLDGAAATAPAPARRRRAARDSADPADTDVAIIGMAGRFPGAGDTAAFWENLRRGVESVTTLDRDELEQVDPRLLADPNFVPAGAVLPDIDLFDAAFFDITARDAATLDPQQRLFLECAWEAFEDAGYAPGADLGPVGVFAGSSLSTYLVNNLAPHFGYPADGPFVEADMRQFQVKLGNDRNYLPTRVSYKLGLRGPSVTVQTACSTSLVALHLAVRSLRSGESDMALAGGVSVIVPQKAGYLHEEGMIRSRDGHCRAFDAEAGGTLFGNGCGVVLLKRLTDALADGDRIYAVVKGSAVNNDGADKVGFTAPSVAQQTAVVRDALADAGVDAGTVGYVETHGTGTAMGDPIEITALTEAFQASAATPPAPRSCAIGSVKTNIGHLDEAAGIAGLIKTALALHHRTLPPSLHFTRPNPRIDFAAGPFHVVTSTTPWESPDGPRRAGVSSFGMGGTNCHAVLQEAPAPAADRPAPPDGPHLLTLSARTPGALRELADRYVRHLRQHPDTPFADVCYTAAVGRRAFEHRLAVVAATAGEAADALAAGPAPTAGHRAAGRVAFVFSGQGSQYPGMGRELYATQPVFRQALDRCAALLADRLPRPLPEVLWPDDEADRALVDATEYAQPALFAVEYALAELWESWGLRPDVVIGHSLGEYVAACRAGVFSLADALTLVAERGRLMGALPGGGRMVAVAAGEDEVAALLADHRDEVAVAAVNGARATVVSGAGEAVARVVAELAARGVRHRELTVSHAFHSPLMRPMVEQFARVAASVSYAPPRIPVVSNVTGRVAGEELARPAYWVDHVLRPVRFADGVAAMAELGADVFVEVSPRPTLLPYAREALGEDTPATVVPTLRPDRAERTLLAAVGALWQAHVPVEPRRLYATAAGWYRRVALPTYPWQRQRHWIDAPTPPAAGAPEAALAAPAASRWESRAPLPGRRLELADSDEVRFAARVGVRALPWLGEHRVFRTVVMPGVAYLATAYAAGRETFRGEGVELRDFLIHRAMTFPDERVDRDVQVVLRPEGKRAADGMALRLHSRPAGADRGTPWTLHVTGRLAPGPDEPATGEVEPLAALRARYRDEVPVDEIYQGEREREIDLGPLWHATRTLLRPDTPDPSRCLSHLELPAELTAEADRYPLHPVLLEACFLALTVTYPERYGRRTYVPVGVEHLRFHAPVGTSAWCHARLRPAAEDDPEALRGDVDLYDEDGRVVLSMAGVLLKRAARQTMLGRPDAAWRDWLYRTAWQAEPAPAGAAGGRWLVLSDGPLAPALAEAARAHGATVVPVATADAADPDALARRLADARGDGPADLVVAAWPAETGGTAPSDGGAPGAGAPDAEAALGLAVRLLHLVRALATDGGSPPRLCVVTRGAQAVAGREVAEPAAAALWGLGRVVALEQPDLRPVLVDLDPGRPPAEQAASLATELAVVAGGSPENQVAYRAGTRHLARLHRASLPAATAPAVRPDATYLVTGGLGGLGLHTARLLHRRGARHLVLAGRSAPGEAAATVLAELRAAGTRVDAVTVDVSDEAALAACLRRLDEDPDLPPLRGVLHLAGVMDDGVLGEQTAERFARVHAAKARGAWLLHRLTRDRTLDFFVLFSSVAAALGAPGQGNYAAANAYLDGLASWRRGLGLPALAVQWGSWAGAGMSARLGLDAKLERIGEGVIPLEQGVAALDALLGHHPEGGAVAVLPIDWPRFLAHQLGPVPFLAAFAPRPAAHTAAGATPDTAAAAPPSFRERLAAAPPRRRRRLLADAVWEQVAHALGSDTGLGPHVGFFSLGLDSLGSIELRNRLQAVFDCRLGQTVVFDHPTLASLTDHLAEVLELDDGSADTADRDTDGPADGQPVAPAGERPEELPDGRPEAPDGAGDADPDTEDVAELLARKLGIGGPDHA